MDRCDQIRQSALAFAVEARNAYHDGAEPPADTIARANAFHKFLLGGHESLTEKEVVEMEAVIRQDEASPPSRTYVGENVVVMDPGEVA